MTCVPPLAWSQGATTEGGRGPSIWDTFAKVPGHIFGNQTGDVAVDFYHRFLEVSNKSLLGTDKARPAPTMRRGCCVGGHEGNGAAVQLEPAS